MKRMIALAAVLALTFAMPAFAQAPVETPQEPVIDVAVEPVAEVPAPVEPTPEPVVEPEPVTLADAFAALTMAITAGGSHSVTVAAADENLQNAQTALATAEDQHAAAMDGQTTVETDIRGAAQALVDHLRSAFGVN